MKDTKQKARKFEVMNKGMGDDRLPIEVILDQFQNEGARDYSLMDSGEGRKLEKVGNFVIDRQCAVAFWSKKNNKDWTKIHAYHQRSEKGGGSWDLKAKLPDFWFTKVGRIVFKTKLTSFGHLGFFVEQASQWDWFYEKIPSAPKDKPLKILNLFAYTGASSVACALAGAQVTHVDAARGVVDWAKQNAALNRVPENSIRFIVEDCKVFLEREAKRGNFYDGVIMDPPSFGRGPNKEVFKIEEDILPLLRAVKKVLAPECRLFHFSSHSQGFSPEVLKNLAAEILPLEKFSFEGGEMLMSEQGGKQVPSGQFIRLWR
ncbi:MAG: class I SAM-dependent methyltransferase [bacterium]